MLRTTAICASLALGLMTFGCASSSNQWNPPAAQAGAVSSADVNQGRFPVPQYSNVEQPNYALTGQNKPEWQPADPDIMAGNARVTYPANQ
jgi:hypothetical protein